MSEHDEDTFRIGEALRFGWRTTQAHLKPLPILGACYAFLALLNGALDRGRSHFLLALALQLLEAAVTLAFVRVSLALEDGRPADIDRPAELTRGYIPFVLTWLLYALVVAGGLLLLVAPGILWAVQLGFATFASADRSLDPLECLHESSRLTRGLRWRLLGFALACGGVNLLGALALGVGLLWTIPTTGLAAAHVYRRLQARASVSPQLSLSLPLPASGH